MQIKSLEVKGYGVYKNPIKFPIQELGEAEVIAIVGRNGVGKSTLLDLFPAGFLRETPGHGNIVTMCSGPDAYVSETYEIGGREIKVEHRIDTTKKATKQSSFMWVDGDPVASGKVPDFLAKAAEYFPARSVYYSTVFHAQESEDRLSKLKPGARKELFAKFIGCERFEKISKAASKKWTEAAHAVVALNARAAAIAESIGDQAAINEKLDEGKGDLLNAKKRLNGLTEEKKKYDEEIAKTAGAMRSAKEDLAAKRASHAVAHSKLNELDGRLDRSNNRMREIDIDIEALYLKIEKLLGLEKVVADGVKVGEDIEAWELKNGELLKLKRETDQHRLDLERSVRDLNIAIQNQSEHRARLEEALLDKTNSPCSGGGEFASCSFLKRAIAAETELATPEDGFLEQKSFIEKLENLVEYGASDVITMDLELGEKPDPSARDAGLVASSELGRRDEYNASLEDLKSRKATGEAVIAGIKKDIADAEVVSRATADEAQSALNALQCLIDSAELALSPVEAERLSDGIEVESSSIRTVAARVAHLGALLEKSEEEKERYDKTRKEAAEESRQADHWENLAKAFGKNGIQAMEIDQSLPEVSRLTNTLLHECFSNRFTVELRTTRDGKEKQVEGFFIHLIDSESGLAGDEKIISVGLRVIVDEALALACAIYNAQRNEMKLLDLARDECSGALHGDLAVKYIHMLRKAIRIGGFKRCYFIAHQEELWEEADVRMVIEDGKCELR